MLMYVFYKIRKRIYKKAAFIINAMVEQNEQLLRKFTTIINIKKKEIMLDVVEIACVGVSLVSTSVYLLTNGQLPYMSAFASWAVSRAVEELRTSHFVGEMEYSNLASASILRRVQRSLGIGFLKSMQTDWEK